MIVYGLMIAFMIVMVTASLMPAMTDSVGIAQASANMSATVVPIVHSVPMFLIVIILIFIVRVVTDR